jgi:16S rRNA pseudouridine516 synthase
MRLDKYVSHCTGLPRKQSRRAIGRGRVYVNGERIADAGHKVGEGATVELDGEALEYRQQVYFMLHKPADYVCSSREDNYPSALTLVPEQWQYRDLHMVGRLDADVTGLLLITDDGKWSHRITAPAKKLPKIYQVETGSEVAESAIDLFRHGLLLHGDEKLTRPAELRIIEPRLIELTLHEGRYHQVKRMLAAINNRADRIHRIRVGGLLLDEAALPAGQCRELTANEIDGVFQIDE